LGGQGEKTLTDAGGDAWHGDSRPPTATHPHRRRVHSLSPTEMPTPAVYKARLGGSPAASPTDQLPRPVAAGRGGKGEGAPGWPHAAVPSPVRVDVEAGGPGPGWLREWPRRRRRRRRWGV
ncbi:MAG: hypothetical protein ACK4SY_10425, partial [Pyrobaculum sp.]